MLRLESIRLAGFKSFVDPINVKIPSHLVGVVGPNGCGKSNIIDAVRWVMGESSAKQLRGEGMTDVIFNGTSSRKPVSVASVELRFDNSDGSLGGQYAAYSHIAIRREVTRDGQSNYYLNGTRCRRRDITDIFLGTGLGPRSYAIIEQGTISRVVEAKPEELRHYLEEAAGIAKYKERRRETENRIKHTRENLSRVTDIQKELEAQLEKLSRQAKAAEKYGLLKEEEKRYSVELQALQWLGFSEALKKQEERIEGQKTLVDEQTEQLAMLNRTREQKRQEHHSKKTSFNEIQERYYDAGSEITKIESQIRYHEEKIQQWREDLKQVESDRHKASEHVTDECDRFGSLQKEIAVLKERLSKYQEETSLTQAELEKAEQSASSCQQAVESFATQAAATAQQVQIEKTRIQHLEQRLSTAKHRISECEAQQSELDLAAIESEQKKVLAELTEVKTSVERYQSELRSLNQSIQTQRELVSSTKISIDELKTRLQEDEAELTSQTALQQTALGRRGTNHQQWLKDNGLMELPRVAEKLTTKPGWEHAVETVLGKHLEAICATGLKTLKEALEKLDEGDVTFVDLSRHSTLTPTKNYPNLLDVVETDLPLQTILGPVYTAQTLDEALEWSQHISEKESIVTKDGFWIGAGWVTARRGEDFYKGILGREGLLANLREQVESQRSEISHRQSSLVKYESELKTYEEKREQIRADQMSVNQHQAELLAKRKLLEGKVEQVKQRQDQLTNELESLNRLSVETRQELETVQTAWHQASRSSQAQEAEKQILITNRDESQQQLSNVRTQAQEIQSRLHQVELKFHAAQASLQSLELNRGHLNARVAHLEQRHGQLSESLKHANEPLVQLQSQLEAATDKQVTISTQMTELREEVEVLEEEIQTLESQRSECDERIQALRGKLESLRLASQSDQVRRTTIEEQLASVEANLEQILDALPEDATESRWQEQLNQTLNCISRLGAINLAAIEEYEEQAERKEYLNRQKNDLEEALSTLESAIAKIDRETRERFKETFEKVNNGLKSLFPRLFGGGSAELALTEDNLLMAGVTVMARPPGKRNGNIHQLSGGEKALTAVAFVFSIFHLNPAPFCMLDEVDAPLDDSNVNRFCNLVKEISDRVQVLFISHNKVAIEMAEQMIGVTMKEPGVSRLVAVDVDEAIAMAEESKQQVKEKA